MKFDSNWNTDAVYHHLASQTYLKGWRHGESSVYYIEKDDRNIDSNWNRNTRTLAGVNNFFSRKAGALFQSLSDCEKYFEPLNSFSVEFKGEILKTPLDLNEQYDSYNEWLIYDSTSNLISNTEKENLKSEIDKVHIKDIEVGWDRLYENNWPDVKRDILDTVTNNKGASVIPCVRREELIEFMVSLEWRTKPTHPELESVYEAITSADSIKEYFDEPISEESRMYPFIKTQKEFFLHNLLLKYYHQFLNKEGLIYLEAQKIINDMNIELLIAEKGSEFITSDNPVCRFLNSDNTVEYIFPINADVACAVRKGEPSDSSQYYISYLKKYEVFEYNQKLKENCYKGYILQKPSLNLYFK